MALTISTDLPIIYPQWNAPENVVAFSTTRQGGGSESVYESLNVGDHVGDNCHHVNCNRQSLPFSESIQWMKQVHGSSVVLASKRQQVLPEADAMITTTPNVFCAVMTADCIPILLTSKFGDEVAAVHAGWRGLVKGVIASCLDKMKTQPQDILAWIGPHISQQAYEVDRSVQRHFSNDPQAFSVNQNGRFLLNLSHICRGQLCNAGVVDIHASTLCTYHNEDKLFSHRRATHQGFSACGRQAAIIGLL